MPLKRYDGGSWVDLSANPIDAWPVGSIFLSAVSTDPATMLGGGTWVAIGTGRTMVGFNGADTDFDTALETGGAKTHTLTEANLGSHDHTMAHTHSIDMPTSSGLVTAGANVSHTHTFSDTASSTSAAGAHAHTMSVRENPVSGSAGEIGLSNAGGVLTTKTSSTVAAHSHTVAVSGTTSGHSVNHTHTMDHNHASFTSAASSAANTGLAGSATAVNHMNPYIVVYMWRRTA